MKGVVFFVQGLNSGGIENYLLRYLTDNAAKFKEVIIICKGGSGGVLENQFTSIKNLKVLKKHIGYFNIYQHVKLVKWFKEHRDYVICDFTGNFAAPIILSAKFSGIKKRVVFYRSSTNRFKEDCIRLVISRLFRDIIKKYATNILSNSKYAFEFFYGENYIDNRMQVIYNGVNTDEFLHEENNILNEINCSFDDIIIGHVGRFNPAKNHKTIIQVAEILINKGYKVHFLLCGKDVPNNLSVTLKNKSINNRFSLFNNRSDISKVLNTIDIFYFPSITEGQPNALIEAWIKGLPFVSSNIPPIENITPTKYKEYLVGSLDIEEHERVLIELINNPWTIEQKKYLSDFAKTEFDSIKRFDEFTCVLINS